MSLAHYVEEHWKTSCSSRHVVYTIAVSVGTLQHWSGSNQLKVVVDHCNMTALLSDILNQLMPMALIAHNSCTKLIITCRLEK